MILLATVFSLLRFTASFEVTVPQRRVLAVRGQPVVLGCSYTPDPIKKLDGLVVTWQTEDNQVLHSFYFGQDQLDRQNPRYRNRTALYHRELLVGNASLRLERVGPHDSGRYVCHVSSLLGTGRAEVQLEYAAFYGEPRLSIQVLSSSISLQFQSEGFPAPQVEWTDSAGQDLMPQEELSGPGEDGLLNLRTSVTVEGPGPGPGRNLSFILRNSVLGQVLERPISFNLAPGALGQDKDVTRVIVPLVCFFSGMLCLGLLVFTYFRCKRKRAPRNSS